MRADKVKFTTVALGCEDHRPFNVTIFFYLFFILWLRPRAQLLIIMPDSQNWTIFTPWLKKSPERKRSLDNKQIHCSTSRLICMAKYSTIFKHSCVLCLKDFFFFSPPKHVTVHSLSKLSINVMIRNTRVLTWEGLMNEKMQASLLVLQSDKHTAKGGIQRLEGVNTQEETLLQ